MKPRTMHLHLGSFTVGNYYTGDALACNLDEITVQLLKMHFKNDTAKMASRYLEIFLQI